MTTPNATPHHISVMLPEVLAALEPQSGAVYVDGTFGAGGYSRAILAAAPCRVIGIDRDPSAVVTGRALAQEMDGRFTMVQGPFGDVAQHLQGLGIEKVDGLVLDIGVSSMQIDDAARGFSFQKDGPLDMRMDPTSGIPASVIVNSWSQEELADIFWRYGEERASRRIAAAIVKARAVSAIETTTSLANIVRDAIGPIGRKDPIHPATRSFQALRIVVNDELGELERALAGALTCLKPQGRLVVVSFHSLEDSIVKAFMQDHADGRARPSRYMPDVANDTPVYWSLPTRKAIKPSEAECASNPRARSARLRYAIRTPENMSPERIQA